VSCLHAFWGVLPLVFYIDLNKSDSAENKSTASYSRVWPTAINRDAFLWSFGACLASAKDLFSKDTVVRLVFSVKFAGSCLNIYFYFPRSRKSTLFSSSTERRFRTTLVAQTT